MERSFTKDENERATSHRKFQKVNALALEQDIKDSIPRILRSQPHTAKVIALFANATPRAAVNWIDGLNQPQLPHIILLARQIPELKAKVLEWLDAEAGDSGDDPARVLDDIHKMLQARMK